MYLPKALRFDCFAAGQVSVNWDPAAFLVCPQISLFACVCDLIGPCNITFTQLKSVCIVRCMCLYACERTGVDWIGLIGLKAFLTQPL